MYLGEGKSGGEINGKIAFQIANSYHRWIRNQITSAKDPWVGRNISRAEFYDDVKGGEEIDDSTGGDEEPGPTVVHGEAIATGHETE